jgi:hypothetical protein
MTRQWRAPTRQDLTFQLGELVPQRAVADILLVSGERAVPSVTLPPVTVAPLRGRKVFLPGPLAAWTMPTGDTPTRRPSRRSKRFEEERRSHPRSFPRGHRAGDLGGHARSGGGLLWPVRPPARHSTFMRIAVSALDVEHLPYLRCAATVQQPGQNGAEQNREL